MNQPLTRSASDKMIAGVCGGVARSFGIDASIVRILAVVLSLFFGVVLVLYIALWLVLPLEEGGPTGFDDLKKMFSGTGTTPPPPPPSDYR
jgi:phage shock protein C